MISNVKIMCSVQNKLIKLNTLSVTVELATVMLIIFTSFVIVGGNFPLC